MPSPLADDVLDRIFRAGRSYNGFTDQPVTDEDLRALWDLTKWGPTSANMSPTHIVWCRSPEAKETLAGLATGSNGEKIRKAPVTAILGYDVDFHEHFDYLFPHNPDVKSWFPDAAVREQVAFRNGSMQGGYFILAARALGLDTGPMSGFDNAAVDAEFFAGTTIKSNFVATVGHGDAGTIFDRLPRFSFEQANIIR